MPTDPMADGAPQTDPTADSPDAAAADQAQDSPTAQSVDWEARFKATQAELTRQAMARSEAERAYQELLAAAQEPDEPDDGDPTPTRTSRAAQEAAYWRAKAEESEWLRAQSVFGEEVLDAYTVAAQMTQQAQTPGDWMTAFETYHQLRSQGMSHAQAAQVAETAAGPQVQQALAPRVDPNRSDAAPSAEPVDPKRFEGGANGGVRAYLAEQFRRQLGG